MHKGSGSGISLGPDPDPQHCLEGRLVASGVTVINGLQLDTSKQGQPLGISVLSVHLHWNLIFT